MQRVWFTRRSGAYRTMKCISKKISCPILAVLRILFGFFLSVFVKDLLVTAVFAFMWLVSSSAWGKGLTDVKWATDPSKLLTFFEACKNTTTECTAGAAPHMGRLNASVVSFREML